MTTRIAEANKDHAEFLAWVCLAAARSHLPRGFWDFFLDESEERILSYLAALAVSSRPHPFHYSAFFVAEVDGRPAAALCGFTDEENGFEELGAVLAEADESAGRPPQAAQLGMARMGAFMAVVPQHPPRAWIVENVATLPEFRRRGLVTRLLEPVLERGAARGAPCADIGVFIGNDPAQLAYEKAGFRTVSEKRSEELERTWGSPGLRLLRRAY
ncbi:MAG: GNAT family N-acetyltransferase [Myxococcota bacterium]